ncbi:MAG: helix-turn-helix transcriptional regulator, partial [Clostridia bacterium]|nr:helix-turn-helix transcriptional regulator [Clostridia bacterium]
MKDYAFSKYIVALRHRQGLSRFDLARKLGIGYVTVAKWENAEAMPTVEELQRLSVFFNLSCEAIRAHSFVELPGCSVKAVEKKTAPETAPAPVAEPAPI